MNLSGGFSSFMYWMYFYIAILQPWFYILYCIFQSSLPLSAHVLYGLLLNSSKTFWKASVIVIPFLSFKGTTHVYLQRILMIHNENWNSFL